MMWIECEMAVDFLLSVFGMKNVASEHSWATKALKRCDEALNSSSLQFLCQRLTLHCFIAFIFCGD
jgi:hypothetical protein